MAEVEEPVMLGAQGQEVGRVRQATRLPRHDVVDVKPTGAGTAGHPAAPVTLLDDGAGALGDRSKGPAHAYRLAVVSEQGPDPAVARQVVAHASGHGRAQVEVAPL